MLKRSFPNEILNEKAKQNIIHKRTKLIKGVLKPVIL